MRRYLLRLLGCRIANQSNVREFGSNRAANKQKAGSKALDAVVTRADAL